MLIRPNGGSEGIKNYLETGQMKDRFFTREQLDERVILFNGDLDLLDDVINKFDSKGEKYFHYTFGFKEDHVPVEVMENIVKEFREYYFKAYRDDEICFYAEAHLPKIKSFKHKATGELIERKPHIHINIAKVNLLTGESISFDERSNIKYLNAFQEYINCKYGLESPKDNPRFNFNSQSEMISRYKGDTFTGIGKDYKEKIFELILEKNTSSRNELEQLLVDTGYKVRTRNAHVLEKSYLNIIPPESARGINLKEFVFSDEFLKMSRNDKLSFIEYKDKVIGTTREDRLQFIEQANQNKSIYYEAGLPRDVSDREISLMHEWVSHKADYEKYVDRNQSRRKAYKLLTTQNELHEFVEHYKNKFYEKVGGNEYELTGTDIGKLSAVYTRVAFNNLQSAGANIGELSTNVERNISDKISPVDPEWLRECGDEYARVVGVSKGRHVYDSVGREYDPQKGRRCSFIEALTIDYLNQKMSRDEIKQELAYFKQMLKANVLFELAQKTHGVIPEKYKISVNKDGSDRILCGSHNYSVVDFCIKELNLSWNDTLRMLKATELMQREVDREVGWSLHDDKYLAQEYKLWIVSFKAAKDVELKALQQDVKAKYEAIGKKYKEKIQDLAKTGQGYHKREENRSLLKMERLLENRALYAAKNKELENIKAKYNLDMQESYRKFLVEKAELGDDRALQELRRLRVDFEEYQKTGSIRHVDQYLEYRLDISHAIDSNGVITYKIRKYSEDAQSYVSLDIIKDMGKRIDVLNVEPENLKLALDLALSKYGTRIELFGSTEFRHQLVELTIKEGYKVTFKDQVSEDYRKELIHKMQAEYKRLEQNNANFLKSQFNETHSLLVVDAGKVTTIDNEGKYTDVAKVVLFDIKTKREYELSGNQLTTLERAGKLKKGDMLVLDGSTKTALSVNPYFWNKYTSDLEQGVLISDYLREDKLIIEFPSWRQAKYKEEYFTIEQPKIAQSLEKIGYMHGDLVSIKPTINVENREIEYEFQIIGDGPYKAQAKKDILEADITAAKAQFSSNHNVKPEEISKEICGKVIDFGPGKFNGAPSYFIVMENGTRQLNANVLSAKEAFCRQHGVAIYNLEKEVVGTIIDFGPGKFNKSDPKSAESYFIKLNTLGGERTLWGVDLERMINSNQLSKSDNIYVAMIGEVQNGRQGEKGRAHNKYESMKLSDEQVLNAKEYTAPLYSRYWNTQFKELIENGKLNKNASVLIAKVGEGAITESYTQREYSGPHIDLSIIKQEIKTTQESINKTAFVNVAIGEIVEHGVGRFNENSPSSYYLKIQSFNGGIQTLWGKDLARLVEEANLDKGQSVYIVKSAGEYSGNGKTMVKYNAVVLENTTRLINEHKAAGHVIPVEKLEHNIIGTVIECGTRTIKGTQKSFIKIETVNGKEYVYWDKNLRTLADGFKKGDTIYFSQSKEQELFREVKLEKFSCALVGNDIDQRSVALVRQREIENSRDLGLL